MQVWLEYDQNKNIFDAKSLSTWYGQSKMCVLCEFGRNMFSELDAGILNLSMDMLIMSKNHFF